MTEEVFDELENKLGVKFKQPDLVKEYLNNLLSSRKIIGLDKKGDLLINKVSNEYIKEYYSDKFITTRERIANFLRSNDLLNKLFEDLGLKILNKNLFTIGEKARQAKIRASLLEYIVGLIEISNGSDEAEEFIKKNVFKFTDESKKDLETLYIDYSSKLSERELNRFK